MIWPRGAPQDGGVRITFSSRNIRGIESQLIRGACAVQCKYWCSCGGGLNREWIDLIIIGRWVQRWKIKLGAWCREYFKVDREHFEGVELVKLATGYNFIKWICDRSHCRSDTAFEFSGELLDNIICFILFKNYKNKTVQEANKNLMHIGFLCQVRLCLYSFNISKFILKVLFLILYTNEFKKWIYEH